MLVAASDNLNPNQLKMFMSPNEILGSVDSLGDVGANTPGVMGTYTMKNKAESAQKSGLARQVAAGGVKKPVDVFHHMNGMTTFINGHHRLAAQFGADPDRLMPVMHHNTRETIDWGNLDADPTGDKPYGNR